MTEALAVAEAAGKEGEVPIGAILVDEESGMVIKAANRTQADHSAVAHAELLAIAQACQQRGRRLKSCTLYVTLEPCPMCAGAIASARIPRVVFGAKDPRAGAYGSLIDLSKLPLESRPEVVGGILAEECLAPIRSFFQNKRNQNK